MREFLTTTETAKLLGVSRITIFKKIKSGEIKARKIGRNYIINKKDLPAILGESLSETKRRQIEEAVKKTVREYGETLKLLGKE